MTVELGTIVHSMCALLFAMIAILMLMSILKNFYFNKNNKMNEKLKYYPAIQISTIICLIGYVIRLLTLSALHIPNYYISIINQIISTFFLFINKPLIQIYFILRLYYTFKESVFASNKSTYIILIFVIIIEFLCIILYFIYGLAQLGDDNEELIESDEDDDDILQTFNSTFSISLLIIAVISDLCVSYIITHLFISKLFKLLLLNAEDRFDRDSMDIHVELIDVSNNKSYTNNNKLVTDHNNDHIHNDLDHLDLNESIKKISKHSTMGIMTSMSSKRTLTTYSDIELKNREYKMVKTITRYTLLSSITLIFAQIYFIVQLVHILSIAQNDQIDHHSLDIPLAVLSMTDAVFAILSIYLNFVFARKWYKRICSLCHKSLENICKRLTKREIYKQSISISNEYQLMH